LHQKLENVWSLPMITIFGLYQIKWAKKKLQNYSKNNAEQIP